MDEYNKAALMQKYPNINAAQMTLISCEAYDRGHSAGQDEVNMYAHEIAAFVNNILKAV